MKRWHKWLIGVSLGVLAVSCGSLKPRSGWDPARGPVVPHDTFPADCSLCHEGGSWNKIRKDFAFDHEKQTGVALNGAHAKASCLLCHNDRGPVKMFADRGCAGCHEDVHRGRQGAQCASCHNEQTWRPKEVIAQHNRTRFPLVGGHAAAECFTCHPGAQTGNFEGADPRCEGCHARDITRSTSLDHVAQGLTTGCQRCHNSVAFKPAQFTHPASFPLSGGHAGRSCNQCHTTPGVYTGLSTACVSCHQANYNATTNPNHQAAGFSTTCQQCHNTVGWTGANFVHTATFPLANAHAGRQCTACHTGGVYTGLSTACVSCHQANYNATTNPNHQSAGFPTTCQTCHTTVRWTGATFNHPSSFPLTNAHAGRSCGACHTTPGVYTGLSTACVSCHQANYNATTNPNHQAAGFSTACQQCHNTVGWTGANFVHTATFPLTNAHAGRQCTACHTGGVYTGLSTACVSCHLAAYNSSANPPHLSQGFPQDCQRCHGTVAWRPSTFVHRFPITSGPHRLACAECHRTPSNFAVYSCTHCHEHAQTRMANVHQGRTGYQWVSTACVGCHPNGRH